MISINDNYLNDLKRIISATRAYSYRAVPLGPLPPDITIEKLNLPHASSPRNLLIAQVLYRTTFIESWGSGFRRMTEVCDANGVKAPVFSVQDNNFCITFYKGSDGLENSTEKTTEKILRLLSENPNLTNQELAEKCGLTEDGVYYNIKILRQKGLIVRIGPDKGGYWLVKS